VRWTEVRHDLNGVLIGAPTHWEALLQTQVIPPGNEDAIISNARLLRDADQLD
jgi:hypothetical protein